MNKEFFIKKFEDRFMSGKCNCVVNGHVFESCVLESGKVRDCDFAKDVGVKENCEYWMPILSPQKAKKILNWILNELFKNKK